MSKELHNFRDAQKVLLLTVIEGEGVEGDPKRAEKYVVTRDGSVLGKLDREWMYKELSEKEGSDEMELTERDKNILRNANVTPIDGKEYSKNIYRAVVTSDEWKAWERYNEENNFMFDVYETREADLMSGKHWDAFISFIKDENQTTEKDKAIQEGVRLIEEAQKAKEEYYENQPTDTAEKDELTLNIEQKVLSDVREKLDNYECIKNVNCPCESCVKKREKAWRSGGVKNKPSHQDIKEKSREACWANEETLKELEEFDKWQGKRQEIAERLREIAYEIDSTYPTFAKTISLKNKLLNIADELKDNNE